MKFVNVILFLLLLARMGFSQEFPVDTIRFGGDTDQHINIVVLGDGYLETQLETYTEDVKKFIDDWFSQSPFMEYRNFFNVFSIPVPSEEEGASLDPNKLINNYFGSSFNSHGLERLLVPQRASKISGVLAANFPNYDQVVMLVNSTKYGGSGGWVATASKNYLSSEIAIHEIGHSFANLGDEYWAGEQYASERANRTKEYRPEFVRWKSWLDIDNVGIYQYESPGEDWYRPHQNCKMRQLNNPFCPVCREGFVETIHRLSTTITYFSPALVNSVLDSLPAFFSVKPILPVPNTLQITWRLNDVVLQSSKDTLFLHKEDLNVGENTIEVEVRDTSFYSKKEDPETYKSETRLWKVNHTVTSTTISDKAGSSLDLYPNPNNGKVHVNYRLEKAGNVRLEILDVNGKTLEVIDLGNQESGAHTLPLSIDHLNAQLLLVKLQTQQSIQVKKLLLKK